ncbi:MAG: endonuclease MutS2 [Oscillospiraceae bacterium]|nr:endonuclease MutS2 [Oscillospiraceae bacterium]MBR3174504.1 endonuclease MutS2 [Oscillospiraceae bacterium]
MEKSYSILELPAILQMLAAQTESGMGREAALALQPSVNAEEVRRRLQETNDAARLMTLRGSPSFSGVRDIRPALDRARLGGILNGRELLDIAGVARCARLCKAYIAEDKTEKTSIDSLFHALRANKFLEERITTALPAEDEVADSASQDLADIRRKMRAASARAREALNKILSSPSYAKALQEPIITMRSDRYVLPVRADHKSAVPGLVHDISASGMTLFIEPMAAVKANNELRELAAREKLEIERILGELSAACAEYADDFSEDCVLLVRLDLIFAKARLSFKMDAVPAGSTERGIVLRRARHPLLDPAKAVPIDLTLGEDFDTLVITGPNTGGKTVALKTIGLLAAMNQCGLHIPAADGSALPVFNHILADIGDEQSIEQSLSTFSAHMKNIVQILDACEDRSLVLFDELGAGTDPTEGAALAISIIEYVRRCGAITAATTHYAELKIYATNEPGVQNASCEFDVETLRPTYRLLVGVPGKSNAFAISGRLGLPESIIRDAEGRIGTESRSFEATIEKLEQTRLAMERDRTEAERLRKKAEEEEKKASMLRAELSVRLEKAEVKARRDAQRILDEARETADGVYAELDEMRRRINDEQETEEINRARTELRRRLNEHEARLRSPEETLPQEEKKSARPLRAGDTVQIKTMGVRAQVLSVSKDGTVSLKAGIMTVTAKEDELLLLEEAKPLKQETAPVQGTGSRLMHVPTEIDLRGMESIEAVLTAERYLDSAAMAKLKTVTIIHGKGTGALRDAVRKMLKTNKLVKSWRQGLYGEGEAGVTVVELK